MTFAATTPTLYPEMFPGPFGASLAGKALERGNWSLDTLNPRDFATDKHRTVDDTPAGGGGEEILHAELDLSERGRGLTSLDTDGHYSRPDVFELNVDTRAKDGVNWQ